MFTLEPAAREADEQRSLDVYNAVFPHDAVSLDEVHSFKRSVLAHLDLLGRVDDDPAASVVAVVHPGRPQLVYALPAVLPRFRGRGLGTAMYEAVSAWARERGLDLIEAPVRDDDPDSLAYARRRGFSEHRHEKGVVLDLRTVEPEPVHPPDGIAIVAWADRAELARGIYDVASEAYLDIPGSDDEQMEPFEDWLEHDMQASGDRPDATFVALAGEEVIGYAKFSLTAAQPAVAHHDITGVKRTWRGRGVARALKATQIAWAKANGFAELHTRNDERNGPIRRLNDEFGYRPGIGRIYVHGPLAQPS